VGSLAGVAGVAIYWKMISEFACYKLIGFEVGMPHSSPSLHTDKNLILEIFDKLLVSISKLLPVHSCTTLQLLSKNKGVRGQRTISCMFTTRPYSSIITINLYSR
jgi:hypothetical protein